jgi:hypothetical protein
LKRDDVDAVLIDDRWPAVLKFGRASNVGEFVALSERAAG